MMGRKCDLEFPCDPGNLCVKGVCCSFPSKYQLHLFTFVSVISLRHQTNE